MRTASSLLIAAVVSLAACSSTSSNSADDSTSVATTTVAATDAATTIEAPPTNAVVETTAATDHTSDSVDTTPVDSAPVTATVAAWPDRPYEVFVPSSADGSTPLPLPLVMLLHGYGASGIIQEEYLRLQPLAEERGFLYVHPEGTIDSTDRQFWNATDACCDDFSSEIDDSAYLLDVITQIEADYRVDVSRIFVIGHSNGGFMSYRMACDHADVVAAIVSLAAATFADASQCAPSNPVSVVEIHGTNDSAIAYDGGTREGQSPYPSAATTVATWAGYDGCSTEPALSATTLDLDSEVVGNETSVTSFADCPDGVDVELWTIADGEHVPNLTSEFGPAIIDFLFAHPKPG